MHEIYLILWIKNYITIWKLVSMVKANMARCHYVCFACPSHTSGFPLRSCSQSPPCHPSACVRQVGSEEKGLIDTGDELPVLQYQAESLVDTL